MIFVEFSEFSDRKELRGFDRMTSCMANEHLKHSTSKSYLTDRIFKLTLIHAPLILSDSLNSMNSLNIHHIWGKYPLNLVASE